MRSSLNSTPKAVVLGDWQFNWRLADWGGMKAKLPSYQRHRFPSEIISHAVWLYPRFCLTYREVEELFPERGITVTYESVRQWYRKFVREYVRKLKKRQGR